MTTLFDQPILFEPRHLAEKTYFKTDSIKFINDIEQFIEKKLTRRYFLKNLAVYSAGDQNFALGKVLNSLPLPNKMLFAMPFSSAH